MTAREELLALAKPTNSFQRTVRKLAEAAMSVTHHDASDTEPGYIYEVRAMERRFARILKGKMKPLRSARARANTGDAS